MLSISIVVLENKAETSGCKEKLMLRKLLFVGLATKVILVARTECV